MKGNIIEYYGDIASNSSTSNWHTRTGWDPNIVPDGVGKKAIVNNIKVLSENACLQFLVLNITTGPISITTSTGKKLYFKSKSGTGNCTVSGVTSRVNTHSIDIVLGSDINLSITSSLVWSGIISGIGNINILGTTTFSGVNTFLGTVTITGDTLTINSDNALGNSANALVLGASGTLIVSASTTSSRNITLTGNATINVNTGFTYVLNNPITGAFTLTKTQGGILEIANTYSGGSLNMGVNTGTILISGSSTSASSMSISGILIINGTITNSTGGISAGSSVSLIKGIGTCAKLITMTSSSTIEPGNGGVGTLTLTNGLVMSTAGIYSIRTSGSTVSKIAVTGNLTIRGTYTLPDASLNAGTYDILTYTGTATVTTLTLNALGNNTGRTITFFHDTVNKKYQMIAV